MAYQPEIIPSSEKGQALQTSIQKQLAFLGWSTEDDNVMAEYCLVMLGNRKTAAQISTELSDLIGSDFDESFVQWLFAELKSHYPDPNSTTTTSTSAPTVPAAEPTTSTTINSANSNSNGASSSRPNVEVRGIGNNQARNGGAVFAQAVTGVKRDSREIDGAPTGPRDVQRPRFDHNGVPSGPRNPGNGMNAGNQNGGGRGARGNNGGGGASLLNRMGLNQARNNPLMSQPQQQHNAMGMPPQAMQVIAQTIEAVKRGAHPSALASIPFPALAAHPLVATLPPGVMAQAQAHAMAQAQAFAAMSNAWNVGQNGQNAQAGFNPNAAAFQPAFAAPPQQQQQQQPVPQQQYQQAPPQFQAPLAKQYGQPAQPKQVTVVLPDKPSEEAICKHGVDCSKPQCPYSHPSPVATKESGLVLSSEPCEKQVECTDPDCPKSHVSPSQKSAPPKTTFTNFAGQTTFVPPAATPSAPVADPHSISGAGEKPCKFAGACTRAGCVFVHPWDNVQTGTMMPCRYGLGCTRPGCHFSHPPGRKGAQGRGGYGGPGIKNLSATFNKTSLVNNGASGKKEGSIGAWPKEDEGHISDRLKRFAGGESMPNTNTTTDSNTVGAGEATEKIIPGQSTQSQLDSVEIKGLEASEAKPASESTA